MNIVKKDWLVYDFSQKYRAVKKNNRQVLTELTLRCFILHQLAGTSENCLQTNISLFPMDPFRNHINNLIRLYTLFLLEHFYRETTSNTRT